MWIPNLQGLLACYNRLQAKACVVLTLPRILLTSEQRIRVLELIVL